MDRVLSPERRSTLLVHAALTLSATLFSANYIISKVAMHAFTPFVFAYLRIVGSAIILVLLPRRDEGILQPGDNRRLILYSFLGVIINQTFFLTGLSLTSAHVAAILITTIPIFALVAAIVMGREKATALKAGGIAMAATGAALVIGFEGFDGSTKAMIGDLLIILNSLSYALYLVLSKPAMSRLTARQVLSRMFGFAAIAMLPFAAWPLAHERWAAIGTGAWLGLVAVIVGPTVAAYLINAWALGHADSSIVAAYSNLQPVFTVILASVFLGEAIRGAALAAGAMIIAGVYMTSRKQLLAVSS